MFFSWHPSVVVWPFWGIWLSLSALFYPLYYFSIFDAGNLCLSSASIVNEKLFFIGGLPNHDDFLVPILFLGMKIYLALLIMHCSTLKVFQKCPSFCPNVTKLPIKLLYQLIHGNTMSTRAPPSLVWYFRIYVLMLI